MKNHSALSSSINKIGWWIGTAFIHLTHIDPKIRYSLGAIAPGKAVEIYECVGREGQRICQSIACNRMIDGNLVFMCYPFQYNEMCACALGEAWSYCLRFLSMSVIQFFVHIEWTSLGSEKFSPIVLLYNFWKIRKWHPLSYGEITVICFTFKVIFYWVKCIMDSIRFGVN